MKYLKLSKTLAALSVSAFLFSSCDKVDEPEPLNGAGQTIVKIMDVDKRTVNIDLVSTPQVLNMVDIRRDIPNETELNKTMKVIVKDDPGAVSTYNAANGTNYLPIPVAQYAIDPGNPRVGTDYTITMNPGEFAKWLKFTIPNALAIDLNKQYAFGFTISTADAGGKISNNAKTIVVEVGVKNDYDGLYSLKGFFFHPTNAALIGGFSVNDIELQTTGKFTNVMYWRSAGTLAHPITNNGALTYFLNQSPIFDFNPTTGAINSITNAYAAVPGSVVYAFNPGYNQRYDVSTKTIYCSYGYSGRSFTDTIKYLGPR
jgi:Domain of unknown function (DUF1735)